MHNPKELIEKLQNVESFYQSKSDEDGFELTRGTQLVFGPKADSAQCKAVSAELKIELPEDYTAFMAEYGPFGFSSLSDNSFENSLVRLMTLDEVVEITLMQREIYSDMGDFGFTGQAKEELDRFIHEGFFFQFSESSNVENIFGMGPNQEIRFSDHDDLSTLLQVWETSFSTHIVKMTKRLITKNGWDLWRELS